MKFLTTLLLSIILCFSLTICSKNDTVTMGSTNIGKLVHNSVDIIGVTYDLYNNDYTLIRAIFHMNTQLVESVVYKNNEYNVFEFIQAKASNLQSSYDI